MDEVFRVLRDPRVSTTLVLAALSIAGLALVSLAWRGAAATLYVVLQLPWVVSGGFAGLALVGMSLGLLTTHLERTESATERAALAELQREALRTLSAATRQVRS